MPAPIIPGPDLPSEEYPIRALVRAYDEATWEQGVFGEMKALCGTVVNVKRIGSGDYRCPHPWLWAPSSLIIDPTPSQIAEERQKAGLPVESPKETAASAGPTLEDAFRAGFLAGCSYGMDQGSIAPHADAPDVDQAWAEYEADHKAGA